MRRQSPPHFSRQHLLNGGCLPTDNTFLEIDDDQRRLSPVNKRVFHVRHIAFFTVVCSKI